MGIDLATWRARIGLNCCNMCHPLQTRWRSSGGQLYQPGVASWGVGEVMNDTPLVLKGCMTVVALTLILQYVVHSWSKLKGKGGGGKVHCHWRESAYRLRETVDGGGTLLLRAIVVVIPLLLVIAGDVETNPGPEGGRGGCNTVDGVVLINLQKQKIKMFLFTYTEPTLKALVNELHPVCASWFMIGLELNIPYNDLICFREKHSDFSYAMCEMLNHWLKAADDPPPSWEAVVTALRSPLVNERNVATQLESKYCAPVQHTMDESKCQPAKTERSKGINNFKKDFVLSSYGGGTGQEMRSALFSL